MAFVNALFNLWPHGDTHIPGLRTAMAKSADAVFAKYGITSKLLVAHVMAQGSLECGAGLEVEENLSYSAPRLPQVWPRHFNAGNALAYAHNPKKLANFIYEPPLHTDLGNAANSNDGWNFRGRGFSQTTGRAAYAKLGAHMGLDLVNTPDLVNDPQYFLECGVADFILCGCLPFAQADNITQVTKHLNGGFTGLADRIVWLHRWKAALV